ncbi:MAG TPA: hypothetical protein VIV60_30010 [Polyangiaceae bacterium]
MNHDVATTLYVGRELLEGKRLYIDILETNPPTIVLFAAAVVRVCQMLRVSSITGYHGFVLLMALAGTIAIQRACRYVGSLTSALLGIAYALIVVGCGAPGTSELLYAFGQREHLFVLAFVPYLVWRLLEGSARRTTTALAFVVGVYASQKPQCAALVVAFELILATRARGERSHPLLAFATGAVLPYALLAILCPPSLVSLWKVIVPVHTGGVYAAFNGVYGNYTSSSVHAWLLVHGVALTYFAWPLWRSPLLEKPWRTCMLLLLPLAYGLVIQQRKFWAYHSIPVLALVLVFVAYLASRHVLLLPKQRGRALLGLTLVAAVLEFGAALASQRNALEQWKRGTGECSYLLKLVPALRPRHNVLYYSTSVQHMRLAQYLNQRLVGRFCHNFDYPALVHEVEPMRRSRLMNDYCSRQVELIRTAKPEAIVFPPSSQALNSADPTMHDLLVRQCHVIPEDSYDAASVSDLPGAFLYLRR